MPLVISRKKGVSFVDDDQTLAEFLKRSHCNRHAWEPGDLVVFENRTIAVIRREEGQKFFTWGEPSPAAFQLVLAAVNYAGAQPAEIEKIGSWDELFWKFRQRAKRCWWGKWFS